MIIRLNTAYRVNIIISLFAIILTFSCIPVFASSEDISDSKAKTVSIQSVNFSDVKKTDWFYTHLEWGVEKRLTNGYPDGTFKAQANVRADEFLAMLMRSYAPTIKVADVAKNQNWADNYYKEAERLGYKVAGIKYVEDRAYNLDRGDVAALIATSLGQPYTTDDDAINFLLKNKLADGKVKNGVKDFYAEDKLTRGEAIAFIQKLNTVLAKGTVKINAQAKIVKVPIDNFEQLQKDVENLGLKATFNENDQKVYVDSDKSTAAVYTSKTKTITLRGTDKVEVVEAARIMLEYILKTDVTKDGFEKAFDVLNEKGDNQTIKVGKTTLEIYIATSWYTATIEIK